MNYDMSLRGRPSIIVITACTIITTTDGYTYGVPTRVTYVHLTCDDTISYDNTLTNMANTPHNEYALLDLMNGH